MLPRACSGARGSRRCAGAGADAALEQPRVRFRHRAELPLEGQVPVPGGPLPDVLQPAGQLDRRDELVLGEHDLGLCLEAPRIGIDLAGLPGPDLLAILVHLAGHPDDAAEGLDAGHVEDDPVTGRDLLRHPAATLLGPDHAKPVLARGAEVVERSREHPGLCHGEQPSYCLGPMADDELDLIGPDEIAYRLDLTPAQLKITYMALKSFLDDFGHDERDVNDVVREVLSKLPEAAAISSIDISRGR